jgi:hypothetical protein
MSHIRSSFTAAAALATAALTATAVAAAATPSNQVLRFTTVTHGTVPWPLAGPSRQASAQVVNRALDAPGQGEEVDFRIYFGVYATVMRPTSGYSLTIRRVLLQRFGAFRQLCAVVTLPRPSGAVTQQKSLSAHYVKIKRGRLGFNVPDHIVLRQRGGGVLFATPGSRTGACRA